MAYRALYRKYRPSTFEEVAGQRHIVQTLKNALASNKIAHAYLFCGPRGTGKTSMAKLFAKALNCELGVGHQCNECENCRSITEGSHPDIIEIDAASNNGVEEVRELIEKVRYLPISGKYKVYIIDEVHMMTAAAFNALLKTLEEPPAHVIFILATTEPHKVLPTIVSRCQRYDFSKVSDIDIKERLIDILNLEDATYDDDAINTIVRLADGGVRDALSILEQLLAYCTEGISKEDVLNVFGLASKEDEIALLKDIATGNIVDLMKKIDSILTRGCDIKRLNSDLLEILKDFLVYSRTKNSSLLTSLKTNEINDLQDYLTIKNVRTYIDELTKMSADFRFVPDPKILLEITLLKLAAIDANPEINEKTIDKKDTFIDKPVPKKVVDEVKIPVEEVKMEVVHEIKDLPDLSSTSVVHVGEKYDLSDEDIINIMAASDKELRQEVSQRWNVLAGMVMNPEVGKFVSLLKDGKPYAVCKCAMLLEYDLETRAEKVNIHDNQKPLRNLVKSITENDLFIYALPRTETVRLQKLFLNMRQVSKLPTAEEALKYVEELTKGE